MAICSRTVAQTWQLLREFLTQTKITAQNAVAVVFVAFDNIG